MSSPLTEFDHLRIPLSEIKSATDNFADEHIIGRGGFGYVYKGQLLHREQLIAIAVKRLDRKHGQGDKEFWTDIRMLSSLKHENLVSIVGFCDEDNEKIIINTYEVNGSLDKYLSNPTFTWLQRLHICVGVARALSYIHYDTGRSYDVIHRNIKSSKIMLDGNWDAKVSGFGLSINNSATRRHRLVVDAAVGTPGYADPVFVETGTVTHKSDVYSFGVVLFEVLCGRANFKIKDEHRFLAPMATSHYEEGKLDEIIHPYLRNQMHPESYEIFSDTAYHCLKKQRAQRPDMEKVVKRLEKAWKLQHKHENPEHLKPPVVGTSHNHLKAMEHLRIPLTDIIAATNNFTKRYLGSGGYGNVYAAELDLPIEAKNKAEVSKKQRTTVAIKCINANGKEGFVAEIELLTHCKHDNIVSLLGFCDEGDQLILVYEHVSNGSLDDYLGVNHKLTNLTWVQRLKISTDIARGLKYLHTIKAEDEQSIVHRDIKSGNILLSKNWVAKIADFGLSKFHHVDEKEKTRYSENIAGTNFYICPEYRKGGKFKRAIDIYSFGVVLFEILSGKPAYDDIYLKENEDGIAHVARRRFKEQTLEEMVDPIIMEEVDELASTLNKGPDQDSLKTFLAIAHKCVAETQKERPSAEQTLEELEKALLCQENKKDKLKVSLEDIKLATQNFSDHNLIGRGGFGNVYKGEVIHTNGITIIAAKRLEMGGPSGQGEPEFLKELEILLEYKNDNVIGLVGYCDELGEKIIVYEYATHKSLDLYLSSIDLTWMKRLKICIDVASGLEFLHGGVVTQDVVIHRDIKSANILLTEDWKAKIADFGLALISPINQEMDYVIDNGCGTYGYVDPQYLSSGFLSKESDIYSLGVVLFEILCERKAIDTSYHDERRFLSNLAKSAFDKGKLEQMVFKGISDQIVPESFTAYSTIAYQCLHDERQKRPTISHVLAQLKKALEFQEDHEIWEPKLPGGYKEIIRMSKSPDLYSAISKKDLYNMLCKGILLQDGKVWFSLGTNGARNEMISAKFSYKSRRSHRWRTIPESRFPKVAEMIDISKLKTQVKIRTQFLSPGVNYGVYLVFKFCCPRKSSSTPMFVNLTYKMGNETLHSYFATWRDDEWMMIELFRFLNHKNESDFKIQLESFSRYYCKTSAIYVEGFEFRAIDNVKREEINKLKEVQQVLKSKSKRDKVKREEIHKLKEVQQVLEPNLKKKKRDKVRAWVSKMNIKKDHMVSEVNSKKDHLASKVSKMKYHLHSAKEVFYGSSNEELINSKPSAQSRFEGDYEEFSRSKNDDQFEKLSLPRKAELIKHHMISAKRALFDSSNVKHFDSNSSTESRLPEEIERLSQQVLHIKCKISSQTLLPNTEYAYYLVFQLSEKCRGLHCPVIVRDLLRWKSKEVGILYFRSPCPWNLRDDHQVPEKREDGWMEVLVWKSNSSFELRNDYIPINLKLLVYEGTLSGLIVHGLEFRSM